VNLAIDGGMALETPQITWHALPIKEQVSAAAINSNLFSLRGCVSDFKAAVHLFDTAISNRIARSVSNEQSWRDGTAEKNNQHNSLMMAWTRIAAKSGSLSIYEFHRLEQAIDKLVKRCPTLESMIDKDARRHGSRLFDENFPDFANVRLFAAHGREMTDNPEKFAKHSISAHNSGRISIDAQNTSIQDVLVGRTYTNTSNGKVVSYDISMETLTKLQEVLERRFATFLQADIVTKEIFLAQLQERMRQHSADQNNRQ
jgi:hypothetical protein